ncbi:MAG: GTP 3',8-cyclase MoaA [Treponema sp.]|jgi:cyclic pyranopterin phosphate synthase|nr:GTP 3',8-cyclase MoaA [Treponema sp.]
MTDAFGRVIDYLRLSITDRCNLRCVYCMNEEGVEWKPHSSMLSFEETLRLCRIMAGMGIRKVKVTGGELLVRKGAVDLVRQLKAVAGIEQVSITTNGVLLDRYLEELAAIPLAGINISLDTLNAETFHSITRREQGDWPGAVLKTMEQARLLGIPVKINCVPLKNINEDELCDIAALAKKTVKAVRFIELMPIGCAGELKPISGTELRLILERRFGALRPVREKPGNGPAAYYAVSGFSGLIGMINAVSEGFCESCNRLRLGSGGLLQPCLSSDIGLDLRSLLLSGASDSDLAGAVRELVGRKPPGHSFSGIYGNRRESHAGKAMSRIGG